MVRALAVRVFSSALLAAAVSAALLAGCGGEPIRDVYFSLQSDVDIAPGQRPIAGTLRISPLTARGFVAGSRIVYRTAEQPERVQRYSEYLWEDVPARAFADDLLSALRAARAFENAVTSSDPARADYLLGGELKTFEHRPTDRPPGVRAELTLVLVDGRSRALLVEKTFGGFEPTALTAEGRTTPAAMVAAFNRLSGRIIGEVIADVQAVSRTLP
jgi:cholesterol transport system auxiliary component